MAKQLPAWLKPAGWGAVVGAVAISFVAFTAEWVVTEKVAHRMAGQQANIAVIAALTPICVAQFKGLPTADMPVHLAALEKESTWQRGDYVQKQGWATMPGGTGANDAVADACAAELLKASNKPA